MVVGCLTSSKFPAHALVDIPCPLERLADFHKFLRVIKKNGLAGTPGLEDPWNHLADLFEGKNPFVILEFLDELRCLIFKPAVKGRVSLEDSSFWRILVEFVIIIFFE